MDFSAQQVTEYEYQYTSAASPHAASTHPLITVAGTQGVDRLEARNWRQRAGRKERVGAIRYIHTNVSPGNLMSNFNSISMRRPQVAQPHKFLPSRRGTQQQRWRRPLGGWNNRAF